MSGLPINRDAIRALAAGELAVMLNAFLYPAVIGSLKLEPDVDLSSRVKSVESWLRAALNNLQNVDELLKRYARGEKLAEAGSMLEVAVRSIVGVLWTYGDHDAVAKAVTWSADNLDRLFKTGASS